LEQDTDSVSLRTIVLFRIAFFAGFGTVAEFFERQSLALTFDFEFGAEFWCHLGGLVSYFLHARSNAVSKIVQLRVVIVLETDFIGGHLFAP